MLNNSELEKFKEHLLKFVPTIAKELNRPTFLQENTSWISEKNRTVFKAKFWDFTFSCVRLICKILHHTNPYQSNEYWWHRNICDWFCAKYYGFPATNHFEWEKRPHLWTFLISILWSDKI